MFQNQTIHLFANCFFSLLGKPFALEDINCLQCMLSSYCSLYMWWRWPCSKSFDKCFFSLLGKPFALEDIDCLQCMLCLYFSLCMCWRWLCSKWVFTVKAVADWHARFLSQIDSKLLWETVHSVAYSLVLFYIGYREHRLDKTIMEQCTVLCKEFYSLVRTVAMEKYSSCTQKLRQYFFLVLTISRNACLVLLFDQNISYCTCSSVLNNTLERVLLTFVWVL